MAWAVNVFCEKLLKYLQFKSDDKNLRRVEGKAGREYVGAIITD